MRKKYSDTKAVFSILKLDICDVKIIPTSMISDFDMCAYVCVCVCVCVYVCVFVHLFVLYFVAFSTPCIISHQMIE